MKNFICSMLIFILVLLASNAYAAKSWNLFFMAQQEVIGQTGGIDVMGYKLGPDDAIVQIHQVVDVLTVGNIHCILYITDNLSIASQVRTWPEFMGFGYTDMIWRIALGLGPDGGPTIDHIKYLTGAHWFSGGEWHFGNIIAWQSAGSPANVWFGQYREIMGTKLQ